MGTALSKASEEKLVKWIGRRKKMFLPVTLEELILEAQKDGTKGSGKDIRDAQKSNVVEKWTELY